MDSLKLKYFSWHISTSLVAVLIISLLCQYFWFPSPFLLLDGTWLAILILACVDVTLGPLLTLLVVSSTKTKRALVLDMSIIVFLQISALLYGLMQIEKERVVAIIHYGDAFHLVAKKEISMPSLLVKTDIAIYEGVYYAMVLQDENYNNIDENKVPALYSPNLYLPISANEIEKRLFPYKNVPIKTKLKYGSKYSYKLLVGKKRTANVIFDKQMKIVDIILVPKAE